MCFHALLSLPGTSYLLYCCLQLFITIPPSKSYHKITWKSTNNFFTDVPPEISSTWAVHSYSLQSALCNATILTLLCTKMIRTTTWSRSEVPFGNGSKLGLCELGGRQINPFPAKKVRLHSSLPTLTTTSDSVHARSSWWACIGSIENICNAEVVGISWTAMVQSVSDKASINIFKTLTEPQKIYLKFPTQDSQQVNVTPMLNPYPKRSHSELIDVWAVGSIIFLANWQKV